MVCQISSPSSSFWPFFFSHPTLAPPYTLRRCFSAELRNDAISVLKRVARHAGLEFSPKKQAWFDKWLPVGLTKKKKSHGKHPPGIEARLRELYAPHNRRLIELLTSLPFNVDRDALEEEFGERVAA